MKREPIIDILNLFVWILIVHDKISLGIRLDIQTCNAFEIFNKNTQFEQCNRKNNINTRYSRLFDG